MEVRVLADWRASALTLVVVFTVVIAVIGVVRWGVVRNSHNPTLLRTRQLVEPYVH